MQFGGRFQNGGKLGFGFELFEEVLADDLPQKQVLLGADDRALLFLLAAGQLR